MIDNEILRSGGGQCERLLPELSAYIDGELEAEAAKQIESHIEKCEKCRKLLSELSSLPGDIVAASIPYPDDLHSRLMGALNEEMSRGRRKSRAIGFGKAMKKHGMWIGAGVAAVICLVLVGSPVFKGSFSFGMDDAKNFAMEDAVMLQNGGIEAAMEMSGTNDEDGIFYTADEEEYQAEVATTLTYNSLSDKSEELHLEMQRSCSDVADDMDMTGSVSEPESVEKDMAYEREECSLLPTFMIPRDELGQIKAELFH